MQRTTQHHAAGNEGEVEFPEVERPFPKQRVTLTLFLSSSFSFLFLLIFLSVHR